jgi:uncharacterized beta-barrel protein YwiB (DUF1934 family)
VPTPEPTPAPTPIPAQFVLQNLAVNPSNVTSGGNVTISVDVLNSGEVKGSYTVTLKINSAVEKTEDITLAGGDSTTVSFTAAKDAAGKYQIEAGDLSAEFTVSSPAAMVSWSLIGGIIAAVLIIGAVGAYLLRRRRGAPAT